MRTYFSRKNIKKSDENRQTCQGEIHTTGVDHVDVHSLNYYEKGKKLARLYPSILHHQ